MSHHPLDDHAARAELVDYIAHLRTDIALDPNSDTSYELAGVAEDLEGILRRWDILHRAA